MAALVIEDGTGVTGADSFGTETELDEFCAEYFGTSTGKTDVLRRAALRRSFVYMSALSWKSGLWPLFGGSIPDAIVRAQFALARVEVGSVGNLSPAVAPSPVKILTKAGDLAWTANPENSSVEESRPIITMAFDLLAPYLDINPARDKGKRVFVTALGGPSVV